jgi:dTMP kinase
MGRFITIEGLDFSGKSTQISLLKNLFQNDSSVVITREPGGTKLAESIRDLVINNVGVSDVSNLLLFNAARRDHLENIIIPALSDGKTVICDRFIHSTIAYQGSTVPIEQILSLHKDFCFNVSPDITIFLDISDEEFVKRSIPLFTSSGATRELNGFDYESFSKFTTIQRQFYHGFEIYSKRFSNWKLCKIDAALSRSDISEQIQTLIAAQRHMWDSVAI